MGNLVKEALAGFEQMLAGETARRNPELISTLANLGATLGNYGGDTTIGHGTANIAGPDQRPQR